jgi:hypothetical protein
LPRARSIDWVEFVPEPRDRFKRFYLMYAPKQAGLKIRIAQFAWVVKNQVRPAGLQRLGLTCPLMGTGMALPWSCISTANLETLRPAT